MRKKFLPLIPILLILILPALAQGGISFVDAPEEVRPGRPVRIVYQLDEDALIDLLVLDAQGQTIAAIFQEYEASAGEASVIWDGMYWGEPVPKGEYTLTLSIPAVQQSASVPLAVGGVSPKLESVILSGTELTGDGRLTFTVQTNMPGTLYLVLKDGEEETILLEKAAPAGESALIWGGLIEGSPIADGTHTLGVMLIDDEDYTSSVEYFSITASGVTGAKAEDETVPPAEEAPHAALSSSGGEGVFTPSHGSPYTGADAVSYWNTPMDITNEEAVWNMLMAPMTVVNGNQKDQVLLYSAPDADSEPVGDITCYSQGVHVLEELDNGWSLVEAYSSSFKSSKVKAWHQLVQGYIRTDKLVTKEVGNKEYAMVVDKLTQRLYLFKEGKLFTTLAVSTGLVNDTQPFNETRSGEFFLVSAVGEFPSGNLSCSYGIRFNDGDILHEVPHIKNADGTKNYGYTEPKLGQRASHGCIRVQRKLSPEGVNMNWIWNTLYKTIAKKNVKLAVWEDWPGRQIPIPADDSAVYYNPDKGSNYHSSATCQGVKDKFLPLTAIPYGELETTYSSLTACAYCAPMPKKSELEAINASYLAE